VKRSSKAVNSAFMLAGQFIGKGSLFVSVMFLSRFLSDADFGGLLFSIVLGQVYLFLSDMGISLVLNRRSSINPSDTQELLSTSVTLRIMLSLLGFPLLMLAGYLLDIPSEKMFILGIIGLSVIFDSFAEMLYSIFRAGEKMVYESVSRILKGVIGLLGVLLVIHLNLGVIAIAFTYLIRTVVAFVASLIGIRRKGYIILPLYDIGKLKELFIASLPLGIMGLLTIVHQRVDNVLIRQMLGENAVAAWQECIRIVELSILLVVPTLLPGALFPSLCRAFRDGGYERQTGYMARIFTGLAVALSLSVVSTGDRFLRFIWGSGYLRNISSTELQLCLYLSVAGLAAVYLMNILLASLLAVNRVKIVIPVTALALILVIGGNLLLMPLIGLPSAGIFYLSGNLFILICYLVFLKLRGYSLPILREALIAILVSLPVFIAIPLINSLSFLPALMIPVLLYIPIWYFSGGAIAIKETFYHER